MFDIPWKEDMSSSFEDIVKENLAFASSDRCVTQSWKLSDQKFKRRSLFEETKESSSLILIE